jgi:hypothetical protein
MEQVNLIFKNDFSSVHALGLLDILQDGKLPPFKAK